MAVGSKRKMRVYFSFAPGDEPVAKELASRLDSEGFETAPFDLDLGPGDNWALAIGKALESCRAMVVLISPEAMKSSAVRHEIEFALSSPKFANRLVPVQLRPAADMPWILSRFSIIPFNRKNPRKAAEGITRRLRGEEAEKAASS